MAPMTRSRADDQGIQPDYAAEYYAQRASGGLIISEAVNVSPMAKGYIRTPGIYTPEQIDSWRPVTRAVHEKGGLIFMQLFHTGRIALPDFLPDNQSPVAPSAVRAKGSNYTDEGMKDFVEPRALSKDEIKQTVQDFAASAKNAMDACFDGIELHAASGYLVQQFLMKPVNQRTDEYGGSIENRARFLFETLEAIIEVVGAERLGVKFSPAIPFNDTQEPDADEVYAYILEKLNRMGIAYVHVADVTGTSWHEKLRPQYKGNYLAGANFTRETGEQYLADQNADAIVYGVKFLANPDLPEKFARDADLNEPDTATFYAPGTKGYTDYPALEHSAAA
jgi:N-ethylmaleimide reductase